VTETVSFPCIEVTQPIGTFYVGSILAADLIAIAYADVRRIAERDVERYLGIQRPLDALRVRELAGYVRTSDATFPTGVILAVSSERASFADGVMRVDRSDNVAKVIDGQHRIAGLEYAAAPFEVPVVMFIDMDIEDQAMVFATINLKQTRVNKSLAYDLYDLAKTRSPQKTCHQITRLLNSDPSGPFHRRIKILGTATPGLKGETVTQALIVDRLLDLVTADAMRDRDLLRRGLRLAQPTEAEGRKFPFRGLFVAGHDAEIARNVSNIFEAVAAQWPAAWESRESGMVLARTTGVTAVIRFLREAYQLLAVDSPVVPFESFKGLLERVPLADGDFTAQRFVPGSSGFTALYSELRKAFD
jgi:DGQHR domain-containing protein